MISKKLLNKVLNKRVISYWFKEKNQLSIDCVDGNFIINVYELAHRCKEWSIDLWKRGIYIAHSGLTCNKQGFASIFISEERTTDCAYIEKEFYADSEPEAIFKACEYILKKLK